MIVYQASLDHLRVWGPQRRMLVTTGGEETPTLSIVGSSAHIYTSLSKRTLAAEASYLEEILRVYSEEET